MNRKFLFLGIALILVITIPLVAAAVTQTQTIHVTGNAKYPHNTPPPAATTTPMPSTAAPTVQFQLFFPNGTAYPTSVTGAITGVNTIVVDPLTGHNGGWMPTCIVVRNTGSTPITINAAIANKNVPPNIDLTLTSGYYGTISRGYGADQATTQQPIQPRQTYYMSLIAFLTPTGSYTPDQEFSYSFDVVVTATQA